MGRFQCRCILGRGGFIIERQRAGYSDWVKKGKRRAWHVLMSARMLRDDGSPQ